MTIEKTTAPRLDSLTPIHKALRRQLFETAVALARADFASPEETAEAARGVETCFGFLREHAEHEDRHVMPIVHERAPGLAEELAADHVALERDAIEIGSLFPKLTALDAAGRLALGVELVRRFQAYVAVQLRHMGREEREVLAVLWSHTDDAGLASLSARIVADIGPARMPAWGAIMMPALNRVERERLSAR
jgi:hypothetical protein